jgi:carbon monoxide dehydrogenase subunit G
MEYDSTLAFPVALADLWAMTVDVERVASSWSWLDDFSVEGHGLQRGTMLHGVVVPPLPYRMRVDVVLDECVPERHITASVHGDLEGTARLSFEADGAESRVHATWTVEMMQRPMRMAARIAHPLLRWGHDRVVDATVNALRRRLVGQALP